MGPQICMQDGCVTFESTASDQTLVSPAAAACFCYCRDQGYLVLPAHCMAQSLGSTIRRKQLQHLLHCCRSTLEAATPWRWALTTGCGPSGTTARASWAATLSRTAAPPLFWCRACQTAPWCSLWLQVGSWLNHMCPCPNTAATCRFTNIPCLQWGQAKPGPPASAAVMLEHAQRNKSAKLTWTPMFSAPSDSWHGDRVSN